MVGCHSCECRNPLEMREGFTGMTIENTQEIPAFAGMTVLNFRRFLHSQE